MSEYLVVPIQQCEYAEKHGIHNALAFYLALKFQDDKFRLNCPKYKAAYLLADIKDSRSRKKYLNTLIELNWIGYNPTSKVYHVNGTQKIRRFFGFEKRTAVKIFKKDLTEIRTFTFAAILCYRLLVIGKAKKKKASEDKERAPEKKRGVKKRFASKEVIFDLENDLLDLNADHVGMSVKKMGELYDLSPSTCSELKKKVQDLGYIKYRKVVKHLFSMKKPNYSIRNHYAFAFPEIANKLRFTKNYSTGTIHLGVQSYDEIFGNVDIKRLPSKKFKKSANFCASPLFFDVFEGFQMKLLKKNKGR